MMRLRSLLAFGLFLASCSIVAAAEREPLTAKTLDGSRFALAEQHGRVVIVNFWATWCTPCRAEMPALDEYYRKHRNEGLAMLAVSLDAGGSAKKIAKVAAPFSFPVARIDDTRIARSAIPTALPATRVYGRDGRLRYDSADRQAKPLDEAAIERIVGPLLAEPVATTR
jgi:thiol-disulfide isomerase/thioredoxin